MYVLNKNKWKDVSSYCHEKIIETRQILLKTSKTNPICSDDALGQMTSIKLNIDDSDSFYQYLKTQNIVAPVYIWNGNIFLRVSFQCYNTMEDIDLLNKYLSKFLNGI